MMGGGKIGLLKGFVYTKSRFLAKMFTCKQHCF